MSSLALLSIVKRKREEERERERELLEKLLLALWQCRLKGGNSRKLLGEGEREEGRQGGRRGECSLNHG
jgi:hypothetical protein